MKKEYPLKTCPWCYVTAKFQMICNDRNWCIYIECGNLACQVKPRTKYISIRKTQRECPEKIRIKVERVINIWNRGGLPYKNEGFALDFDEMVRDFKDGKIGLPGYRQEK